MVDSIGAKPQQASGSVSRVAAPAAAPTVQPVVQQATTRQPVAAAPATQLSGLAKSMAASAPVDSDRVGEIKKAIATGTSHSAGDHRRPTARPQAELGWHESA